jgi:hypothetical protein
MSAAGMGRDMEVSSDMASCAVLTVFPPGVFMTMIPCLVAADTSMVSPPTPARPTILIFTACFSTSALTIVADHTTNPSLYPIICDLQHLSTPSVQRILTDVPAEIPLRPIIGCII